MKAKSYNNLIKIQKTKKIPFYIEKSDFCSFYIINTKSNWKVLFLNSVGQIVVEFSAKSIYPNKRDRKSRDSLDTVLRFFFEKYKSLMINSQKLINNCVIKLIGSTFLMYKKSIKNIVFYIKKYKWNIISIEDRTPKVHNGCRSRKKKR